MEPIKFNNNDKLSKEALIPYKLKRKNIDMEKEILKIITENHGTEIVFREDAVNTAKQINKHFEHLIRQKLIAYDKFMSSHDFNGRLLSPEQAVDEFLKQK